MENNTEALESKYLFVNVSILRFFELIAVILLL